MKLAKRITIIGALMLPMAYFGLSLAAYWYVKYHRGVSSVDYADIALPTKWPNYHVKRGQHHIQLGMGLLAKGKFANGFYYLRVGLNRDPANRNGRLVVAQLYEMSKRSDLAEATLLGGLKYHGNDPNYVSRIMQFHLERFEDRSVIEHCAELLSNPKTGKEVAAVAALYAATAAYNRGDYDQAERYLSSQDLTQSSSGRLLMSQLEWDRGYRELALFILRDLYRTDPSSEAVYAKLSNYLRLKGNHDEARRFAITHQLAFPERPQSQLDQLHALLKDDTSVVAFESECQRAFNEYRTSPANMLMLGDFAATEGQVDLAQQILQHFEINQWGNEAAARLIYVEALIVAKRYNESLNEVQVLLNQPQQTPAYASVATGFQTIARYGLGDSIAAHASLATLITQTDLRAESLLAMANRLIAMGHREPAREILNRAVRVDPRNQPALTRLVELDIESQNTPALKANLDTLIGMRKPSPAVLSSARALLARDAYLFLPHRGDILASLTMALNASAVLP